MSKTYGVNAAAKTNEELALENAHSELMATARLCEKMTEPKRVVLVPAEYVPDKPKTKENLVTEAVYGQAERHITKHNLEAIGGSAIEALAKYAVAYRAFELSAG